MDTVQAAPRASQLIESMRDIGYSLETALADIIDNSITAGAKKVEIYADTSSAEPSLAVVDDGKGMSAGELVNAMRLGSCSPTVKRAASDLGRFGLGLKTASFSQCRRVTVVTKSDGCTSCARWDLDYVEEKNDWLIEIFENSGDVPWSEKLGRRGTMILWEKLDRPVARGTTEYNSEHLTRAIDAASRHLELVFHRFIAPERGGQKVSISVNGLPLEAFDPFNSRNPATVASPVEKIMVNRQTVTVQAFTLPHHKKVSREEWEKYEGTAGYTKNQGFYVYRNKRLIIHGTWFGLARQTELTKLARVRIDMPNTLDSEWKIDVKKASAHPPPQVRDRLRKTIDSLGAMSKLVYTKRGQKLTSENPFPIWLRIQDKSAIKYSVNPQHPLLENFVNALDMEQQKEFVRILEVIGAALPIDTLFADTGSSPESVSGNEISDLSLRELATTVINQMKQCNIKPTEMALMLKSAEPFRSNWSSTDSILKDILRGKKDE